MLNYDPLTVVLSLIEYTLREPLDTRIDNIEQELPSTNRKMLKQVLEPGIEGFVELPENEQIIYLDKALEMYGDRVRERRRS